MSWIQSRTDARSQLLAAFVIYVLFVLIALALQPGENASNEQRLLAAVSSFVVGAILAAACWYFGKRFAATRTLMADIRFTGSGRIWTSVALALFALLGGIAALSGILRVFELQPTQIATVFFTAATAGVFEEFLARGLIFGAFLLLFRASAHRFLAAGLSSAVVFGLLHLSSLVTSSVEAVMQQIFYATVFGLIFALVYLRTRTIWVPVICHVLIGFQPAVAGGEAPVNQWVVLVAVFLPLALVCLVAL